MVVPAHDSGRLMADLHQTLLNLSIQNKLDVATFMHHALYHPQGYYATSKVWGRHGDYITAPDISQVFGEMVALWVLQAWQNDGAPEKVHLVELGPGNGTMMKDMLRTFTIVSDFQKALCAIHVVDVPHGNANLPLFTRYDGSVKQIQTRSSLSEIPHETDATYYIVSNEFLDALPVQQYLPDGGTQHIHWHNNTWSFVHPSHKVREVCPQAEAILSQLKRLLASNGRMIAIDYGYESTDYHTSTLQAMYQHRYVPFLSHVGQADLTSHVNWTHWMTLAGGKSQLESQGQWLVSMGAEARTAQLAQKATVSQASELWTGLARLTDPKYMGDLFKVWQWQPS